MNSQFRKPLMRYGRKLLRQIQKQLGRASLIGDQPFFSGAHFPWATQLEENWHVIREELDVVLQHRENLPNFQDISPDQKHLAKEDKWKTFFFFAYGLDVPANAARCPRTAALLRKVPGAKTAFFSILSARAHIPAHRGPYKGVVRYHLGLIVPQPETQCRIRVDDTVTHWEEGKSLFFDDTFEHEVWNDTDGLRVVLFMDVLRPVRFPLSIINRAIIKAIAASPFITDAKKNHEAWEERMTQLWR
ncbi:MAG: aspartyl/asparaginyl beta-hydroxylase domain-containing protein [Verrucomicrobiota bacterium]|jgi:beta-hydroxylase|nr:aspartyl/asparaginyl beta-hydroxylase domain-containing protein [Chthoniobacterales bacterium]MBA3763457.1 aspartyl/asparaginyl beta-hydroxylase domain-containing protein [Chthoniobacterales bacterium]MDQ3313934.1 aspartyl/asparaginyl beta-hydroxylase domain-containing protein [Verrucomicrobiota bacterium]